MPLAPSREPQCDTRQPGRFALVAAAVWNLDDRGSGLEAPKRERLFRPQPFWTKALAEPVQHTDDARMVLRWEAATVAERGEPFSAVDLSGSGNHGILNQVTVMWKTADLVERPCLYFNGRSAHITAPDSNSLNPGKLSLLIWFKSEGWRAGQIAPLMAKSRGSDNPEACQYGLLLLDAPDAKRILRFELTANGKTRRCEAHGLALDSGWNWVAATYDGVTMSVYVNGRCIAEKAIREGAVDSAATSLLIGTSQSVLGGQEHRFPGFLSSVSIYRVALTEAELSSLHAAGRPAHPDSAEREYTALGPYERRVNNALRQPRDIWGEELIARGGATYDAIKDYLNPLFFSTGHLNRALGAHNLLFAENGGEPPYLVPFANGSRIAADRYDSARYIELRVGSGEGEVFGNDLGRLGGPFLENGYYPILRTTYTDVAGVCFEQESFAGWLPGTKHLVAWLRVGLAPKQGSEVVSAARFHLPETGKDHFACSRSAEGGEVENAYTLLNSDETSRTLHAVWAPGQRLPEGMTTDRHDYERAKKRWKDYWDHLLAQGARFTVPEPLVMNCQRNLLIQNLMMRWRYSLGAVVYHGSFYQPESSDAVSTLGLYGYADAYRDGLNALLGMTKGSQYYVNWENGEKLSHGAHYYLLTHDTQFIEDHTPAYRAICEAFVKQMEADPHGLLEPQRQCGDIPETGYFVWHQAVGWRGLRDMSKVWKLTGRDELHQQYAPAARRLRRAILNALETCTTSLPDGSLFVPRMLFDDSAPYDPITETRLGSYWNLCMPYAFSSGLWPQSEDTLDRILSFIHKHGGTLLGMLRFNFYPTRIGSYRAAGLPGYYTAGFDNVYLPAYLRLLADRGETDRLILSFYGKLAHGQTRNTFVSGEGETIGPRPEIMCRSCYGSPSSANNTSFLLALRLMLIHERFNDESGLPEDLLLAPATPRHWLENGKVIDLDNAPTCFGPVSLTMESHVARNHIAADVTLPDRLIPGRIILTVRAPMGYRMNSVTVDGKRHAAFSADNETVELHDLKGNIEVKIMYGS